MKKIRIVRQHQPLKWGYIFIFFIALGLSLGIGAILLSLQGKPPLKGIALLFQGAFGAGYAIEDSLIKAVPIFLCSLGVALSFRLQMWNIGAEGQYALGAIGATWMALNFPQLPWFVLLPLMFLAASVCGGIWGLIPALLKLKINVNEIIVTLMLNYIGILFLEYLVYGPWKDPASFGFPITPEFSPQAIVGTIPGTRLNWGIIFCVLIGAVMAIFFRYTRLGYELKVCGENLRAARYARMPYAFLIIMVMVVSGALAGSAGFLEVSANLNRLQTSVMAGYGYTAIVVAWLARLNPLYIGIASFLLAGLRVGVENLQLEMGIPAAFGAILEGLILLSVLAGGFFREYKLVIREKS